MYLALYRKYRPRTFDDVISQEHITTTLKNQVANGAAAHAYLFTGSRGTGKTTCAKIMAMAVNCLAPKNGNPCLECDNCREILSGEATDIVEMDAASNRGVDDVRRLRDEVVYTPVSCKYRVYIIDEVHMLSVEAFNALLKTLEEPPGHVKFILATTELHKIPSTISSRCQRFEFRRVDIAESTGRLLEVAEKENVSLDKDAAELISRLSDGGMRDALSLLDRCISADEHITSQTVRDCAGVADNKHLFMFAEMIAANDVSGCIRLLGELHKNSKDLAIVIDELSGHFRDFMLYKVAPNDTGLLSALPDDHGKVAEIAAKFDLGNILRCLALLQECADNIGKAKQRKMLAEMCLVKMCTGAEVRAEYSPRVAEARTSTVQPAFQIQEPARDDIPPKPYEEMSERERITAKRTQDLINKLKATETVLGASAESEPTSEAPADSGADPAESAAPPPDDSFNYNETPMNPEPELPPEPVGEAVPEEPSRAEETGEGSAKAEPPAELTDERWRAAVAEMDAMYRAMFSDSDAKLSGNVLEVTTANRMLLDNVKDEELIKVGEMVSGKLGFPVALKLIEAESAASDADQDKLKKLLDKARQLGIEVKIKND